MSGKLKITGNVLASQKLQAIWENPEDDSDKMSFAPYEEVIFRMLIDTFEIIVH